MKVIDQIKILDGKFKQNESQYDLDREAAKIYALPSNNLDKYELTGKDLGLKPSTIDQAKFEYSPLGKVFCKISKKVIYKIKIIQKNVDYRKLKIRGGNNTDYDFSDYKTFKELFRDLYYKKTTIDYVERKQDEITGVMGALKAYAPRDNKYVEAKNKLLNNAKNFYEGREKIIEGFKNRVFPLYYNEIYEQMETEREEQEKQEKKNKKNKKNKIKNHLIQKKLLNG